MMLWSPVGMDRGLGDHFLILSSLVVLVSGYELEDLCKFHANVLSVTYQTKYESR